MADTLTSNKIATTTAVYRQYTFETLGYCVGHVLCVALLIHKLEVPYWMALTMTLSCVAAATVAIDSCVTLITNCPHPQAARRCSVAACVGSLLVAYCGVWLWVMDETPASLSAMICGWAVLGASVWVVNDPHPQRAPYVVMECAQPTTSTGRCDEPMSTIVVV